MISKLLISCSGVNEDILAKCPTERSKFVGIGLTILLTAIFASISANYFISFVFSNKSTGEVEINRIVHILFSLLWGVLILNLDRNILISIKKSGEPLKEFKQSWFRLILAIFIGLVIATPIELKLFQDEITAQLDMNLMEQIRISNEINDNLNKPLLNTIEKELENLGNELNNMEERKNELYNSFIREAEGTGGTFKKGKGPVFDEKKLEFDKIENQYNEARVFYDKKIAAKDSLTNQIEKNKAGDVAVIENINGPEAQVKALYQLSGLHWFVTCLFILIETLPVFVKIMSKRGPYDEILDRVEYEVYLEQQKIISDKNSDANHFINSLQEINKYKGEKLVQAEKLIVDKEYDSNKKMVDEISEKQSLLASTIINNWYENELSNFKKEL